MQTTAHTKIKSLSSAFTCILFLQLFFIPNSFTQSDFSESFKILNPAKNEHDLDTKIKLHQTFLEETIETNDTISIVIGNLYLHLDYYFADDYVKSFELLNDAEKLANELRDSLILGRIDHYKAVLFFTLEQYEDAIANFQSGLEKSTASQDSFFMAISLEQLALSQAVIENFDLANEYYSLAIPMVKEVCSNKVLASTLNNYGLTLEEQGRTSEAIAKYQEGLKLSEDLGDPYNTIPLKHNLALAYAINDKLNEAERLYRECQMINEENGWNDYLTYTYYGLSLVFERQSMYDSSYYYLQKYHSIKDSIKGNETITKVNNLRRATEVSKLENAVLFEKSKTEGQKVGKRRILTSSIIILMTMAIGLIFYYFQNRRIKDKIVQHQKSLKKLTKILELKNGEFRDLQISKSTSADITRKNSDQESFDFYNLKILTEADWQNFKALFSKSYPKYLLKIRERYPDITESEERMFILIKLQLTSKESANILGVQNESVKKTRSRLRKRLKLSKTENLNKFIQEF